MNEIIDEIDDLHLTLAKFFSIQPGSFAYSYGLEPPEPGHVAKVRLQLYRPLDSKQRRREFLGREVKA